MPKIDKKKAKIRQVLYAGGFLLVSGICITSVSLSSILSKNRNYSNTSFYFDDNVFSSYGDLENYIQSNYFVENLNVENRDKWSITKNGKTFYYNDPALLRQNVANEIKKVTGITSAQNIESNDVNGISANDLAKIHFNQDEKKQLIYRGKNNSIFDNKIDAKKSYLSIHDAYYFNGIYFKSKEELNFYLNSFYYSTNGPGFNNNSSDDAIAIFDSNNNYSSPINKNHLISDDFTLDDTINAKKEFANFVKTNANRYLEVTSSYDGKKRYFLEQDINQNTISSLISNFDYTKIYSNNGKSSYIVDLSQEDENTLFGPYYVHSSDDIKSISNPDTWKKIERDDPLIAQEKEARQISSFLGLILNEENTTNDEEELKLPPINIKNLNLDLSIYFDELKLFNENLYNGYVNFINTIKDGKSYNAFYSIILSYSWIIDNLIQYKANEILIQKTRNIFDKIAQEIDNKIQKLIPNELLYSSKIGDQINKLSFQEILDFKSNTKNISVDISYYTDKIREYSEFINAINIINLANTNSVSSSGMIPYNFDLLNTYVKNQRTFIENNKVLDSKYDNEYKKLWNMFSSTSAIDFYQSWLGTNPNNDQNSINNLNISSDLTLSSSFFNSSYKLLFDKVKNDLIENKNYNYNNKEFKDIFEGISTSSSLFTKIIDSIQNISYNDFVLIKILNLINSKLNINQANLLNIDFKNVNLNHELVNQLELVISINGKNEKNLSKIIYYGLSLFKPISLVSTYFASNENSNEIRQNIENEMKQGLPGFDTSRNNAKDLYGDVKKLFTNLDKILSTNNFLKTLSDGNLKSALSSINKLSKNVAKFIPYIDLVFVGLDILQGAFIPKTNYYSYIYTNNDMSIKYIWNGGQKTSMFWGLLTLSENNINNMKLIEPQKVTSSYSKDQYYYNGRFYEDLDNLKYHQSNDIVSGVYQSANNNLKNVFSFEKLSSNIINNKRPEGVFETIGNDKDLINSNSNTLVNYLYDKVKSEILSNTTNPTMFINTFTFANGHIIVNSGNPLDIKNAVDLIIKDIKATKIVQLPNIVNGKIDYQNKEENEYRLPFNTWEDDRVVYNKTNNQYLIYDPNTKLVNNYSLSNDEIEGYLTNLFISLFEVDSQEVITKDINLNRDFTDFNEIKNIEIYIINPSNDPGSYKFFLSYNQALNYLLTEYNFLVHSSTYSISKYQLPNNDLIFYSKDELIEWAINNNLITKGN